MEPITPWKSALDDGRSLNSAVMTNGELRELCAIPGYGQVTLRLLYPSFITREHRHLQANKYWLVLRGAVGLVLERDGFKSYHLLIPGQLLFVPAGTWHKAFALDEPSLILLVSDHIYDPTHPDKEER